MGDTLNWGAGDVSKRLAQKQRDGQEYVPSPGVFDGTVGSVASTVGALVNVPVAAFGEVANAAIQPAVEAVDEKFGTDIEGFLNEETDNAKALAAAMRPDAKTTGLAGQIIFELGTVAVPAAVGSVAGPGGAIGLTGAFKAYEEANVMNQQGMDGTTAAMKGLVKGAEMAAAVAVPSSFGFRIGRELAAQGAVSAVSGMASRAATSSILEQRGYTEAAQQYDWLNAHETLADLAFGSLVSGAVRGLGAITGKGPDAGKPTVEQLDAAAEIQAARLEQSSSLPGAPVDAYSVKAHTEAMNAATEQLLRGDRVDVSTVLGPRTIEVSEGTDAISRAANKANELNAQKQAEFEAWDRMSPGQRMLAGISDEMSANIHETIRRSQDNAAKHADDFQAKRTEGENAVRAERAADEAKLAARKAAGQVEAKTPTIPARQQRQIDELRAMARATPGQRMEYDGENLTVEEVAARFESEVQESVDFTEAAEAAALCSFGA